MMAAVRRAITSWVRDWEYRLLYRSHVVRGLAEQIEWRLSLNHSAPDTKAAYELSKKLRALIK
jgi:hypothetical protein